MNVRTSRCPPVPGLQISVLLLMWVLGFELSSPAPLSHLLSSFFGGGAGVGHKVSHLGMLSAGEPHNHLVYSEADGQIAAHKPAAPAGLPSLSSDWLVCTLGCLRNGKMVSYLHRVFWGSFLSV